MISVPANEMPLPAVTALVKFGARRLARITSAYLRVLDHHNGIGAARHHAAGGN